MSAIFATSMVQENNWSSGAVVAAIAFGVSAIINCNCRLHTPLKGIADAL